MAGPCGCGDNTCACCLLPNPASGKQYDVVGSGSAGDCWLLDIDPDVVTTLVPTGGGTYEYTNEVGVVSSFTIPAVAPYYAVRASAEIATNTAIPLASTGGSLVVYGATDPLSVTITNPSTSRPMRFFVTGSGHEYQVNATGTAVTQWVQFRTLYRYTGSLGSATISAKFGNGQYGVPVRIAEQRRFTGMTAPPYYGGTLPPSGTFTFYVFQRAYANSGAMTGDITAQGERLEAFGVNTA